MTAPTIPLRTILARADAPRPTTCKDCLGGGKVPCPCKTHDCPHCTEGVRTCETCCGFGDLGELARHRAERVWQVAPAAVRRAVLDVVMYLPANRPPVYELVDGKRPRIELVFHPTEAQRATLAAAGFVVEPAATARRPWRCTWEAGRS